MKKKTFTTITENLSTMNLLDDRCFDTFSRLLLNNVDELSRRLFLSLPIDFRNAIFVLFTLKLDTKREKEKKKKRTRRFDLPFRRWAYGSSTLFS